MTYYVATTDNGYLLRLEGFAVVARDQETLIRLSSRRSSAFATPPVCVPAPLLTPVGAPALPVNRDALLVHPHQIHHDPLRMAWEYAPANTLSQAVQDVVRLSDTQRFLSLEEADAQRPSLAQVSRQPATLPAEAQWPGPEPWQVDFEEWLDRTHSGRSTAWLSAAGGVSREVQVVQRMPKELPPAPAVDLRTRKVRIRRGDRDV